MSNLRKKLRRRRRPKRKKRRFGESPVWEFDQPVPLFDDYIHGIGSLVEDIKYQTGASLERSLSHLVNALQSAGEDIEATLHQIVFYDTDAMQKIFSLVETGSPGTAALAVRVISLISNSESFDVLKAIFERNLFPSLLELLGKRPDPALGIDVLVICGNVVNELPQAIRLLEESGLLSYMLSSNLFDQSRAELVFVLSCCTPGLSPAYREAVLEKFIQYLSYVDLSVAGDLLWGMKNIVQLEDFSKRSEWICSILGIYKQSASNLVIIPSCQVILEKYLRYSLMNTVDLHFDVSELVEINSAHLASKFERVRENALRIHCHCFRIFEDLEDEKFLEHVKRSGIPKLWTSFKGKKNSKTIGRELELFQIITRHLAIHNIEGLLYLADSRLVDYLEGLLDTDSGREEALITGITNVLTDMLGVLTLTDEYVGQYVRICDKLILMEYPESTRVGQTIEGFCMELSGHLDALKSFR